MLNLGWFGHPMFSLGMKENLMWSIGGLMFPTLSLGGDWHDDWSLEKLYHFALHLEGGFWMVMNQGAVWCLMLGSRKNSCIPILARGVGDPTWRKIGDWIVTRSLGRFLLTFVSMVVGT